MFEHWMGTPFPYYIVQNMYLAFYAFKIIYKHNGAMLPGLTNWNGNQYNTDVTLRHGGIILESDIIKGET